MMPRILDIGAFNAVREAGLAKLMPSASPNYRGNGYVRAR